MDPKNADLLWYDYHFEYARDRGNSFNRLLNLLMGDLKEFGYFKMVKTRNNYDFEMKTSQNGIVRVNCIDCLDRSNYIQSLIAKVNLLQFLDDYHGRNQSEYFPLQKA